ncbi:DUF5333 domain-containing protein [Sulfitobacter albidus]|uniref:DUF5333 domain-containing protein n=1 Tax=Sulfitobacter albidus TaxID=2829501 RepID=A0A975JAS2_9RHOB|nr:DUF5333 domain-containing protein [Sulfitobacter albidus]QUJ75043.1 DUF5333 domain-containing protein [Sulfitobacter albidus]
MRHLMIATTVIALTAPAVAAKPALRDVASIDNAVFDVAVANEIRKNCPDISARMVRALRMYNDVKKEARKLGYTDAEIDAYADSDTEKARMKARGAAYFKANGVSESDPQSYCALGRSEIQKSSRIGSLLREK